MTKQQEIIWNIIKNSFEHPTADMIYQQAKLLAPKISVGTVYRNLNGFVEKGALKRIIVEGGPDRYDFNTQEHAHTICVCCGKVKDLFVDDMIKELRENLDGDILSVQIDLYYICKNCKSKESDDGIFDVETSLS